MWIGTYEWLWPDSQVYSSLAEHRESVPPYAVYRPPVGSFVPPSSYASMPVGISQQHGMLQSYRPYLVMKDGKLALGSPTRFNSFSFHQPPVFVVSLLVQEQCTDGEHLTVFWPCLFCTLLAYWDCRSTKLKGFAMVFWCGVTFMKGACFC